ncbi:hypothetical protein GCM10028773_63960 [Spirosoma koreense]
MKGPEFTRQMINLEGGKVQGKHTGDVDVPDLFVKQTSFSIQKNEGTGKDSQQSR